MKAARKAERERRDAADLTWGKMTMKNWAADNKAAINAAIRSKDRYADVKMEDICAVPNNPKGSLFRRYQTAHPDISSQASSYATDDDMGLLSVTSRGDVNWKEAAVRQGDVAM